MNRSTEQALRVNLQDGVLHRITNRILSSTSKFPSSKQSPRIHSTCREGEGRRAQGEGRRGEEVRVPHSFKKSEFIYREGKFGPRLLATSSKTFYFAKSKIHKVSLSPFAFPLSPFPMPSL